MTTTLQSQPVHPVSEMGRAAKRSRSEYLWRPDMLSLETAAPEELSPRKKAMIVNTSKIFSELQVRQMP